MNLQQFTLMGDFAITKVSPTTWFVQNENWWNISVFIFYDCFENKFCFQKFENKFAAEYINRKINEIGVSNENIILYKNVSFQMVVKHSF